MGRLETNQNRKYIFLFFSDIIESTRKIKIFKTAEKLTVSTAYYTRKPRRCLSKIPIWREQWWHISYYICIRLCIKQKPLTPPLKVTF